MKFKLHGYEVEVNARSLMGDSTKASKEDTMRFLNMIKVDTMRFLNMIAVGYIVEGIGEKIKEEIHDILEDNNYYKESKGKRYLVKTTLTATEENYKRAGEVLTYYYGKGGEMGEDIDDFRRWSWKEGWKHKRFAEQYINNDRLNHIRQDALSGKVWWSYDYEIVEYEVEQ